MQQNLRSPDSSEFIAAFFTKASQPSQQETLGTVVVEILRSGRSLNRKALCSRLLVRLELAETPDEEQHLQTLIALLLRD
ncbi:regulatory protein YcgZ [Pantoea sp. C2G6]|uniref:regulatory protein YcgZ n=1 Tax=Pantoea sp. C2G6 TaxID=3243084 RepID=UPI003ED9C003